MSTHDQDAEYEIEFTPDQAYPYQQFLSIKHGRSWFFDPWIEARQLQQTCYAPTLARQEAFRITEEDNVPCDTDWPS